MMTEGNFGVDAIQNDPADNRYLECAVRGKPILSSPVIII
jgi:hypothetical protein